jgi:hypothetical protein
MHRIAWVGRVALAACVAGFVGVAVGNERKLPTAEPAGKIELVATFDGPMLTGVTVSPKGRIFVNFPRWGDSVEFTVAEVKDLREKPYSLFRVKVDAGPVLLRGAQ